ncbi:MAG TPA: metallophosphoesterase family protein [Acidimicrobiales bacterium]|jgi:putative phosphoesterase|nr:metallophosphoesterase family protein [Acidimicrobiales bacterium]
MDVGASEYRRVGFLADTHSVKADGSDLPDPVLEAFAGVDLVVHLGDIGRKGILDRLGGVAPVWVPVGGNKGYVPWQGGGAPAAELPPVRVIDAGALAVGMTFNLAQPDKKIVVGDEIAFPDEPLAGLLKRRFRQPVDAVAFGGSHTQMEQRHEGVLFFNPGSPNLPMEGHPAGVAILDLTGSAPQVEFAHMPG